MALLGAVLGVAWRAHGLAQSTHNILEQCENQAKAHTAPVGKRRCSLGATTAMKVSGHKTRSMLLRYNIVTERETADTLLRADAYLSTQPTRVENDRDN